MSKYTILTLAIFATSLVAVPTVRPADAVTSSSRHIKKHQKKMYLGHGNSDPRFGGPAWSVTKPSGQTGQVCPGIARSFDCAIWPPPIDEDPDRKASGSDGG